MAQIVPRDSISERLGSGLGQGISSGVTALLNHKLQDLVNSKSQQRSQQNFSQNGQYTPQEAAFLGQFHNDLPTQYKYASLLGQTPQSQATNDTNALNNLGGNQTGDSSQQTLQPNTQNPEQSIAQRIGSAKPVSNDTQARLKQNEVLALRKEALPRIEKYIAHGKAVDAELNAAQKLKDLYDSGELDLADFIQNRLLPEEQQSPSVTTANRLVAQLVNAQTLTAAGGRTPSQKLIQAIERGKVSTRLSPESFLDGLNDILDSKSLRKDSSIGKSAEEYFNKLPYEIPKDYINQIHKSAKELSKPNKQEIAPGVDVSSVSEENRPEGVEAKDPSTGELFYWSKSKNDWIEADKYKKGS